MTLECKHLIIAATAVVLSAVGLAKAQTTAPVHLPRTSASCVTRGLVLHYSFESLSRGLVLDASGKGHHGKAVHASLTKEGKIGAAAAFDGSRSYIDLGVDHDLPARDAYTISVWFLNDGKGHRRNGYGQKIFDKTVTSHDFYLCLQWRTGQVHFRTYERSSGGSGSMLSPAGKDYRDGKWHHGVVVKKGTKGKMYIDGKLVSETDKLTSVKTPAPLLIGYSKSTDSFQRRYWSGMIDEFMIYDRALSDGEIRGVFDGLAPGLPHVTRVASSDRIELIDRNVLLGTVENKSYTIATASIGTIKIPATRVIGIVAGTEKDPRVRLVLTDGQVVVSRMTGQVLQLTLAASSSPLKIPISRIHQFGYRVSKDKPTAPVASGPMVTLASGYRLAWTECKQKLQLRTSGGVVDLPSKGVVSIQAVDPAGSAHKVVFRNGSTLTGALLPRKLTLKLQLGPTLTCPIRNVRGFVMLAKHVKPTGTATVKMRNGDQLFGKIDDQMLTIRTEFGDIKIRPARLVSLVFDPKETGQLKAKTWDGATISGRLVEPTVTVSIGSDGPTVNMPSTSILSAVNSAPSPPSEVRKKVEKRVAQLGSESYRDREEATKALVAMGRSIAPLLRPHLKSRDPEIRQRIQDILEKLGVKE